MCSFLEAEFLLDNARWNMSELSNFFFNSIIQISHNEFTLIPTALVGKQNYMN